MMVALIYIEGLLGILTASILIILQVSGVIDIGYSLAMSPAMAGITLQFVTGVVDMIHDRSCELDE